MKNAKPASGASYSSKEISNRIGRAARNGWESLDLDHCDLRDSDLRLLLREPDIKRLRKLSARANRLSVLPPEIGRFSELKELNLSGNQLSALPRGIGQLSALTTLELNTNQLSTLPPEIGRLSALTLLNLGWNRLSTLPSEIGKLSTLTLLNLDLNRLLSLPPEIGRLSTLRELRLQHNQLSALPPEIGKLKSLKRLDLSDNRLSTLPPEIGKLSALTTLNLGAQWLYLHGNEALGLPPEILGPTRKEVSWSKARPVRPADILAFYFKNRAVAPSERRALNEVKVILVGEGSVGKTSLVKKIVHNRFNKREKKTDGIYIEKAWTVPGKKKGDRVQINFWDFGGQEIMHATHQFFLTKRTVYVLVLDARKGENEGNIHYWLKIIQSFGGDAPVLVVVNKYDAHSLKLDETRLKLDYPSIRGFYSTSCETGEGIEALKTAIRKQIHSRDMKHVFDALPKVYFDVKKELEETAAKKNYISIREYFTLCQKRGIDSPDEQDLLLRFLHDLGCVLSFTDPESPLHVRELNVLNPHWVTKGVYKILNDRNLADKGGVLTARDLPRILKGRMHPPSCHPFII